MRSFARRLQAPMRGSGDLRDPRRSATRDLHSCSRGYQTWRRCRDRLCPTAVAFALASSRPRCCFDGRAGVPPAAGARVPLGESDRPLQRRSARSRTTACRHRARPLRPLPSGRSDRPPWLPPVSTSGRTKARQALRSMTDSRSGASRAPSRALRRAERRRRSVPLSRATAPAADRAPSRRR